MKSRPDFAKDLTPYKEQIRSFYQKEEKERKILPDYDGYDSRQLAKMTHLERFSYAVWNPPEPTKEEAFVLFDYRNRNPLTYEACIQVIPCNE